MDVGAIERILRSDPVLFAKTDAEIATALNANTIPVTLDSLRTIRDVRAVLNQQDARDFLTGLKTGSATNIEYEALLNALASRGVDFSTNETQIDLDAMASGGLISAGLRTRLKRLGRDTTSLAASHGGPPATVQEVATARATINDTVFDRRTISLSVRLGIDGKMALALLLDEATSHGTTGNSLRRIATNDADGLVNVAPADQAFVNAVVALVRSLLS
jgi:hypothetical protein